MVKRERDDEGEEGVQVARTPQAARAGGDGGGGGEGGAKKKKTKLGKKEREKLKLKNLAANHGGVAPKPAASKEEKMFGKKRESKEPKEKKEKKKKENSDDDSESESGEGSDSDEEGEKKEEKRTRYTVFVGNLSYDATKEEIHAHFDNFLHGGLLQVRVMTDRGTDNFRGTAFVDVKDKEAYGKALKLHHTKLQDRKINVEPTVGGGGKGESRVQKLFEKTRKIGELRKKRTKKEGINPHHKAKAIPADLLPPT